MLEMAPAAQAPALHLPIWNPSTAAGAAAALAGVLGALLLNATFTIAINNQSDKGRRRLHSLAVAPVALILLLVAAYLYVVLFGTSTETADPIVRQDCQSLV